MQKHRDSKLERRLRPNANPFAEEPSSPTTKTSEGSPSSSSSSDSSTTSDSDSSTGQDQGAVETSYQDSLPRACSMGAIPTATVMVRKEAPQSKVHAKQAMTKRSYIGKLSHRKRTLYDSGDDDDVDGDSPTTHLASVSLEAMKERILGRKLQSSSDYLTQWIKEEKDTGELCHHSTDVVSPAATDLLRNDCTCIICHDILFQPVSLLCGHSFCHACIQWWFQKKPCAASAPSLTDASLRATCPTCRRPCTVSSSLGINTALRSCVGTLFAKELQPRIQAEQSARRSAVAGEMAYNRTGEREEEYTILNPIREESWSTVPSTGIMARRSIVMDAEDPRMRLSLALVASPVMKNGMQLILCLLLMEEDEVEEGGVAWILENHDDRHFIAKEERFMQSPLLITAVVESKDRSENFVSHPISRRLFNSDGISNVYLEKGDNIPAKVSYFCIQHEETGCELHVRWSMTGKNGNNVEVQRDCAEYDTVSDTARRGTDLVGNSSHFVEEQYDEGDDDEDSDLDRWEDDGFIAASSEEEEDDSCQICHDGGHMIVCDGGDHLGCGALFHLECIQRRDVPPGDWICQECANRNGTALGIDMEVGIEGDELLDKRPTDPTDALDSEQDTKHQRKRMHLAKTSSELSDDEHFQKFSSSSESSDSEKNYARANSNGKENSYVRLSRALNVYNVSPGKGQRVAKRQCIMESDDE